MHLRIMKLAANVNTGEVKQKTMKSERGSILTARKHKICIDVRTTLASATTIQVTGLYLSGS